MVKAVVVGATGYTGAELVRILSKHVGVKITALVSRSYVGKNYHEAYLHFCNIVDVVCDELDFSLLHKSDVVFLALPHGHSMEIAKELVDQGKKVVDLGADFRLNNVLEYEKWYGVKHKAVDLLGTAVYGLPEINREKIKDASLIANPGCYPTTVILGLAPLLKHKLIDLNSIVVDSKSGVSGAGRSLSLKTHFSEVDESLSAYAVKAHRHIPEMEQELCKIAGTEIKLCFTPHLIPMTRGMLSTIYANLQIDIDEEELYNLYLEFYKNEYFVRVLPKGEFPKTKAVLGSNFCDLALAVDERTNRVKVLSAIDNLVKGASGQAVQNMNIMFELDERLGLDFVPLYP